MASYLFCAVAAATGNGARLEFMVMGDWGGTHVWPYFTPGERAVAKDLGARAAAVNASFTLALGDNFYDKGVTDTSDPRFKTTFEDIFTAPSLQGARHFRLLAGNHDHYGNVSAQLAYSAISSRWHFPSLWYDFVEVAGDGSRVHVLMIDTVTLAGNSRDELEDLSGDELPGPMSVSRAEAQWQWINTTLHSSEADYLFVAGHYPVWSVCGHGPTSLLVERLNPMLHSSKATGYIGGHDHCAEYFEELGVTHHGVGASHDINRAMKHKDSVPAGLLKWHYDPGPLGIFRGVYAHFSASKAGLIVRHYLGSTGELIFTSPVQPPRKHR